MQSLHLLQKIFILITQINIKISDEEIEARKAKLEPFKLQVKGYLKKYAMHVSSADRGAIEILED